MSRSLQKGGKPERVFSLKLSEDMAERIARRPLRGEILPDEQVEILTDWLNGMTVTDLAKRHGRGKATLIRFISEARTEARALVRRKRGG